jgi:hypothetical protein
MFSAYHGVLRDISCHELMCRTSQHQAEMLTLPLLFVALLAPAGAAPGGLAVVAIHVFALCSGWAQNKQVTGHRMNWNQQLGCS